ncbi:MAG: hypothetical protein ABGW81_11010 [Paracoccaceae bacterium]
MCFANGLGFGKRTIEASVSADLAIHAALEGTVDHHLEVIPHNGGLPELPLFNINMYVSSGPRSSLVERLANLVRGGIWRAHEAGMGIDVNLYHNRVFFVCTTRIYDLGPRRVNYF